MSAASLDVLLKRLKDLNAESKSDSAEDVADAITSHVLGWCVCCRLNDRVATFRQVYEHLFQRQLDGSPLKQKRKAG